MSSSEGLLSQGIIKLFGRPFTGLQIGDLALSPTTSNPMALALRAAATDGRKPSLARIYAVDFLGTVTKLPEPMIILVLTDGQPGPPVAPGEEPMLMWLSDRLDMALRIDIKIGWMEDVLLAELNDNSRSDLVGRDGNLVGRDGNLVGRDGNLIGRSR